MRASKLKRIKAIHKLVIHKLGGTDREYYLESAYIDKISDDFTLKQICAKCFPLPKNKGFKIN